jgi:DNA-binding phage protein
MDKFLVRSYDRRMTTSGFPDARDRALMSALKGAIKESGYVVETLATEVEISKESLGRYLRAEREMGVATFARICRALNIPETEMFERAESVMLRATTSTSITPGTQSPSAANGSRRATAHLTDQGE